MVKRSVFRRALLLFIALFMFSSCNAAEGMMAKLGFDTHNYRGEKTLATHIPDSETARELAEMMSELSVNSPYLSPFSGAKEAAQVCRDAVLNRMLAENYARYAGNTVFPNGTITVKLNAPEIAKVVVDLEPGGPQTCRIDKSWKDGVWTVTVGKKGVGYPGVLSIACLP